MPTRMKEVHPPCGVALYEYAGACQVGGTRESLALNTVRARILDLLT